MNKKPAQLESKYGDFLAREYIEMYLQTAVHFVLISKY